MSLDSTLFNLLSYLASFDIPLTGDGGTRWGWKFGFLSSPPLTPTGEGLLVTGVVGSWALH